MLCLSLILQCRLHEIVLEVSCSQSAWWPLWMLIPLQRSKKESLWSINFVACSTLDKNVLYRFSYVAKLEHSCIMFSYWNSFLPWCTIKSWQTILSLFWNLLADNSTICEILQRITAIRYDKPLEMLFTYEDSLFSIIVDCINISPNVCLREHYCICEKSILKPFVASEGVACNLSCILGNVSAWFWNAVHWSSLQSCNTIGLIMDSLKK